MKHVFISPHLDDAVLSAGNYISTLTTHDNDVLVITIFTDFNSCTPPFYSKKYMFRSGSLTLQGFRDKRIREDIEAMDELSVTFIHLGFIDGGFRTDRKKNHIYPSAAELFSCVIHQADISLIGQIRKALMPHIKKTDILYGPLGNGGHIDHQITHEIIRGYPNTAYYWLDQPYAIQSSYKPPIVAAFTVKHSNAKTRILGKYKSQLPLLFPHGLVTFTEFFYSSAQVGI